MPDLDALRAAAATPRARWSWRSAAAPTRRSWRMSPTTRSGRSRPGRSPRCRRRWPARGGRDCRALAAEWGLRWSDVATDEMDQRGLPPQRRRPLLLVQGRADGCARTAGVDAGSDGRARRQRRRPRRPPARAAGRRRARCRMFPLVEAGFTKADVRAASRRLGLRTWDKPAAACLAVRVSRTEHPSTSVCSTRSSGPRPRLRALGFLDLRVRHYEDLARIEVPIDDLPAVVDQRALRSWPRCTVPATAT